MAIKYSFVDSETYGTEDINDIARSLVGAGVAPFIAKDSYNVSDLNVLTSALVGAGAQLDGCKCMQTGNAVTVSQGIIYFESGVTLTVDSLGYTVELTSNTAGYIYAYYSPTLQKADILFAEELPADGEYVLLAEISEAGAITDKRIFAQSKVATLGGNCVYEVDVTMGVPEGVELPSEAEAMYAYIDGVEFSKFNYIIFDGAKNGNWVIYNIKENNIMFRAKYALERLYEGAVGYDTNCWQIINNSHYYVKIINNKLVFYRDKYYSNDLPALTAKFI